ncbi:MAG: diguanylate cyclase [Candidatus Omnitrophota bacterium]|nr:diguanylate cyclase [Candidatus Omnitrophota bacterium]
MERRQRRGYCGISIRGSGVPEQAMNRYHRWPNHAHAENQGGSSARPLAITEEMLIEHIVSAHPETAAIFEAFQVNCEAEAGRSLKELQVVQDLDVEALRLALNQSLGVHDIRVPVPELLWGSSCDGMMVIDGSRRVLAINPTVERWLGHPSREIVGQRRCGVVFACQDLHGELLWDHPERCPALRAMRRLKPVTLTEYTIRASSGARIPTSASYTPIQPHPGGPVWALVVMRDNRLQKRWERELLHRAARDPLTGLPNRTVWFTACARELTRAARHHLPLAIAMADLDGFKAYNDAYGHPAGDELLKAVAGVLQAGLRATELIARYGGDELILLLPDTDADGAMVLARRLCQTVAQFPFASAQGDGQPTSPGHAQDPARAQTAGPVTLSIGVAVFPRDGTAAEALVAEADRRLFEAKRRGRNSVVGSAPAGERRHRRRIELEVPVWLRSPDEGPQAPWHEGRSKNLSPAGVFCTVPQWRSVAVGEVMRLSIPIPPQSGSAISPSRAWQAADGWCALTSLSDEGNRAGTPWSSPWRLETTSSPWLQLRAWLGRTTRTSWNQKSRAGSTRRHQRDASDPAQDVAGAAGRPKPAKGAGIHPTQVALGCR